MTAAEIAGWEREVERRFEEARADAGGELPIVDLTSHHPRGAVPEEALRAIREAPDRARREAERRLECSRRAEAADRLADMLEAKGNTDGAAAQRARAERLRAEAEGT